MRISKKVHQVLKQIPGTASTYRVLLDNLVGATGQDGFHEDIIYQGVIEQLLIRLPITSFVETGTFLGDSTAHIAARYPSLPILSCEINDTYCKRAIKRLRRFQNIKVCHNSSVDFLNTFLASPLLGDLPLFYLDAHWYDYWPLEDEIEAITSSVASAVIVIDDFHVPGYPDFGFDVGGLSHTSTSGKSASSALVCGLELILPRMNPENNYNILFPHYTSQEAYPKNVDISPRGHIVILQNLAEQFASLLCDEFVANYYHNHEQ